MAEESEVGGRRSGSDDSGPLDFSTSRLFDSIAVAASQRHEETVALLQELVRVPSVNPWRRRRGTKWSRMCA